MKGIKRINWLERLTLVLWTLTFFSHFFSKIAINYYSIDKLVFAAFMLTAFFRFRMQLVDVSFKTPLKYFGGFIVLSALVNGFYAINLNNYTLLWHSINLFAFYLFSIVCYIIIKSDERDRYIHFFLKASMFGLGITFILMLFGYRWGLFFNPNQLGRLTVFLSSIVLILSYSNTFLLPKYFIPITIGLGAAISIGTNRRAALLGFAVLLLIELIRNTRVASLSVMVCIVFLSIYYLSPYQSAGDNIVQLENRWSENDPEDTFLGRGLGRIIDNPNYILFGAGEGADDRFESIIGKYHEIHATYGNILFNYGFLGFILFVTYQLKMMEGQYYYLWLLLPILVYTTFHNDIRCIYFLILPFLFNTKMMVSGHSPG